MPLYKSPKSGKLIEIESKYDTTPGSKTEGQDLARDEAVAKGWRPVHQLVSKSGKQINVDDDGLNEALSKGWMLPQVRDAKRSKIEVGAGESLLRGVAQGGLWNFADEAQAGIRSILPGQKKSYAELRDEYQAVDDASEDQNPLAFYGGAVGTGLASLGAGVAAGAKGAATLGATVAQGARMGALEGAAAGFGAGRGEAASQIESAGLGGLTGGLTGGVGAGIGGKLVGRPLSDPAKQGGDLMSVARAGAREGAKDFDAWNIPIVDQIGKAGAAVKGAAKSVRDVRAFGREVNTLGSGKALDGVGVPPGGGDFDAGADLFLPGASRTKEFVASQAGQLSGNVDAKTYRSLLEKGADDLADTLAFDPKVAAKGLAGDLEGLQGGFETARTQAFREGQDAAAAAFDVKNANGLMFKVDDQIARATSDDLIQPRSVKVLESIKKDLARVMPGLRPDAAGVPRPAGSGRDTFRALQEARQRLDSEIAWNSQEKIGTGERLLRELRGEIDQVLKTAPGKREADEFFQKSIDVEGGFFGATEFRGPSGRMEVDEFKLKRLLGDNDAAGRFANQIENARAYFSDPRFPEATRKAQLEMIDRIDAARKRYGDKITMQALRQSDGPSSPAINAKAYLLNRKNLPIDAIGQPANDLRSRAEFTQEFVHKAMGKRFQDLSPDQQKAVSKLYLWRKSNPQASPEELQSATNRILGGSK